MDEELNNAYKSVIQETTKFIVDALEDTINYMKRTTENKEDFLEGMEFAINCIKIKFIKNKI